MLLYLKALHTAVHVKALNTAGNDCSSSSDTVLGALFSLGIVSVLIMRNPVVCPFLVWREENLHNTRNGYLYLLYLPEQTERRGGANDPRSES